MTGKKILGLGLSIFVLIFSFVIAETSNGQVPVSDNSIVGLTQTIEKVATRSVGLSSTQSNSDLSNLAPVVIQRKKLLLDLIKKDPKVFLNVAISDKVRNILPQSLQTDIEVDTTATSYLEIIHIDDFKNPENSTYRYFVNIPVKAQKARVSLLGIIGLGGKNSAQTFERVEIFPTKPILMRSGAQVKLRGYKLAGLMAVDNSSSSGFQVVTNAPRPDAIGDQKTLVLLLKNRASDPDSFSVDKARDVVFNGQFQKFMQEQSYGKVSFSGDVYGWYTLGHSLDCYGNSSYGVFPSWDELGKIVDTYKIDLRKYDRLVYLIGENSGGCSDVGKNKMTINGNDYNLSELIVEGVNDRNFSNYYYNVDKLIPQFSEVDVVLSHEMGHSLGTVHANSWTCTNGDILYGDCSHEEYGNRFDVMGYNGMFSRHFNAYFKQQLGWIPEDQVIRISKSGIYTLNPLELANGTKLALVGNTDSDYASYSVEFRKAIGFDSSLNSSYSDIKTDNQNLISNQDGILINKIQNVGSPATELLDMSPRNPISRATLNPSTQNVSVSSLEDSGQGITIGPVTNVSTTSISFIVDIYQSKCMRVAPLMINNYSAQNIKVALGEYGNVNLQFTNQDYGCGPSNFEIVLEDSILKPTTVNYYSDIDISLEPGATGWGGLNFLVPPETKPGSYKLIVDVINKNSGQKSTITINLQVYEKIVISSITPSNVKPGTSVTINGKGFAQLINNPGRYLCISGTGGKNCTSQIEFSDNDIKYIIPDTISDCGESGKSCTTIPIPDGKYKITIRDYYSEASADLYIGTYIGPSVKIKDSKLEMTYDNQKNENILTSSFDVELSAGSTDQMFYKYAFYTRAIDDGGNYIYGQQKPYENLNGLTPNDMGYFTIPAGTKVNFTVKTDFNPKIMFAGVYYSVLDGVNFGDSLKQSYIDIPEPNKTNALVVIGEQSPYIDSISPSELPSNQTLVISGVRFSTTEQNIITLSSYNSICPVGYTCSDKRQYSVVSFDGKTLRFVPNIEPGHYVLQVTNPKTGASNIVSVNILKSVTEQSVIPDRKTVNSGQSVILKYTIPPGAVSAKLKLYCPSGMSAIEIGVDKGDLCNDWKTFTGLPESTTVQLVNKMAWPQNVVPNFYVYFENDPNYAIGVSSNVAVLPVTPKDVKELLKATSTVFISPTLSASPSPLPSATNHGLFGRFVSATQNTVSTIVTTVSSYLGGENYSASPSPSPFASASVKTNSNGSPTPNPSPALAACPPGFSASGKQCVRVYTPSPSPSLIINKVSSFVSPSPTSSSRVSPSPTTTPASTLRATSSSSPTPSSTPTTTITVKPSPAITPTPTILPTPTVTPLIVATPTPTAVVNSTVTQTPSPTPTVTPITTPSGGSIPNSSPTPSSSVVSSPSPLPIVSPISKAGQSYTASVFSSIGKVIDMFLGN